MKAIIFICVYMFVATAHAQDNIIWTFDCKIYEYIDKEWAILTHFSAGNNMDIYRVDISVVNVHDGSGFDRKIFSRALYVGYEQDRFDWLSTNFDAFRGLSYTKPSRSCAKEYIITVSECSEAGRVGNAFNIYEANTSTEIQLCLDRLQNQIDMIVNNRKFGREYFIEEVNGQCIFRLVQ